MASAFELSAVRSRFQTFALRWHLPVGVCLGAGLYLSFYVEGLRFFDNDYDWINQAVAAPWAGTLADILRPVPADWGFSFRPVQVLLFKVLHGIFGERAAAFYGFKCLAAGAAVAGIAVAAQVFWGSRRTALMAAGCFALASSTFASALWVSDFELVAQTFALAGVTAFWHANRRLDTTSLHTAAYQAIVVLLVVLAHRTKGSAKILPFVFATYLALFERDRFWKWAPALGLTALTVIPLFSLLDNPIPPFTPFSEDLSQGWKWRPANLDTLFLLLVGNAHPLFGAYGEAPGHSLLTNLMPWLLWPSIAGGALGCATWWKGCRIDRSVGLVLIWLAATIASFSAFPRLPEGFMSRYVVVALVPASLLVARSINDLAGQLKSMHQYVAPAALAGLFLAHGVTQVHQTRQKRETLGQAFVAYDRARGAIAQNIWGADILILGFPYGYNRERTDTNVYHHDRLVAAADLDRPLYVLVRSDQVVDQPRFDDGIPPIQESLHFNRPHDVQLKVGLRPVASYHGLTDSLYDEHIYRSRRSFVGLLFEVTSERVPPQRKEPS